ncbi:MAG: PQQ-binding-like beta-propeller repeat protein [Thermoanaerobaculia bacterium]|nr:PQQ-binding-like beta-propeller repeat protein [Thermoanaerobaculia bacterium]
MEPSADSPFLLGDWTVRPRENRLEREGESRTIEPKVMDVLVFLAAQPERIYSRQEILDGVWRDTFVGDEVLTNAVWELRNALGDEARDPTYIRTVPRRGYGLVAPVTPRTAGSTTAPADHPEWPSANKQPIERRPARWWILGSAAVLLLLLALLVRQLVAPTSWPVSIALLPIESLPPGEPEDSFALALTDVLTAELANTKNYQVPARTAVADLLARGVRRSDIAQQLETESYLEGTLAFVEEDRVQLTLQLVDRSGRRHFWSGRFEDDLRDRIAVQRRLARRAVVDLASAAPRREPRQAAVADREPESSPLGDGWQFRTGGEIWAQLTVAQDSVLVGSDDGRLYRLDLASGEEIWRFDAGAKIRDGVTVAGNRVYLTACGYLQALRMADGRELWRTRLSMISPPTFSPGRDGESDLLLGGTFDRRLVALDADDGAVLWSVSTVGEHRRSAEIVGRNIVVGTDAGELLVVAPRGESGKPALRKLLESPISGVSPIDDDVLAATQDGFLYRLGLDGTEVWRRHLASEPGAAPAVGAGVIYQGTLDGRMMALDATSGESLWSFRARDAIQASPTVAGSRVLFGSFDHDLYAVDAVSGSLEWRFPTDGWVTVRPVVAAGRVVVAGIDGVVRSLPIEGPAQQEAEPDWPQLGEPRVVAEETPPELLWRSELRGPERLSPTGRLVVVSGAEGLTAVDSTAGTTAWHFATHGRVLAKPLIHEEMAIAGDLSGWAFAVDLESGAESWRRDLGSSIRSSAVVDEQGVLYLGDLRGNLHAMDLRSGTTRWVAAAGEAIHGAALVHGDRVLVGNCGEHVLAFERATGDLAWKIHAGECVVNDGVRYGRLAIFANSAGSTFAVDTASGARKWTHRASDEHIWYRPLLVGDTLFLGSGDYFVYSLSAATGIENWRFRTGNRAMTEVARRQGTLLFGSHDRNLYAVDLSTSKARWRIETSRPVKNLATIGDVLYFLADDRYLFAYSLMDTSS